MKDNTEVEVLVTLQGDAVCGKQGYMLISHAPCKMCSLRIKEAGVTSVFYRESYRDLQGVEYLQQSGVEVQKI